jgi:DNA-directed RNA polymerase specialized sigma24 family protein
MLYKRTICRKLADGGAEYQNIVFEILNSRPRSEQETAEALARIATIIEGRIPGLIRSCAIEGDLLEIHRETVKRRSKGMSQQDAEEIASVVVENILKALYGQPPRENPEGWVNGIRRNASNDHYRKRSREKNGLDQLAAMRASATYKHEGPEAATRDERVAQLSETIKPIVKLLRAGKTLVEIAEELEMSIAEINEIVQECRRSGGRSRRSNRSRRKRLS